MLGAPIPEDRQATTVDTYEVPETVFEEPTTAAADGSAPGDDRTPTSAKFDLDGPAEVEEDAPTFGDDGGSMHAPTKSDPESDEDAQPLVPRNANEPL
jgi:hypothetical protein